MTAMITHNIKQGTQEWLDLRAKHFNASEANAMMGTSPYLSRTELLNQKKTGIVPEVNEYQQRLYDAGHAAEKAQRALIEDLIDEDLFPVVATRGNLLASSDGITLDNKILYEHKFWNEELAESVRNKVVPESHVYQLEQQLYVFDAQKVIFVVSDGTEAKRVHCWYESDPKLRKKMLAGWTQFEKDLENHEVQAEQAKVVGIAPETLSELTIQVESKVIASNLDAFKANALVTLDAINTDLESDQDFADAEKTIKWCKSTEDKLAEALKNFLSGVDDIFTITTTIEEISSLTRTKRLDLEKKVKSKKEQLKNDVLDKARQEIKNYLLSKPYFAANFLYEEDLKNAAKGKKTLASLKGSVDDFVASSKIAIDEKVEQITENMKLFKGEIEQYSFLFDDDEHLARTHDPETLKAVIDSRIRQHLDDLKKPKTTLAVVDGYANEIVDTVKVNLNNGLSDINSALGFEIPASLLIELGVEQPSYSMDDLPLIIDKLTQHLKKVKESFASSKA